MPRFPTAEVAQLLGMSPESKQFCVVDRLLQMKRESGQRAVDELLSGFQEDVREEIEAAMDFLGRLPGMD